MKNRQLLGILICTAITFISFSGHGQNTTVTGQLKGLAGGNIQFFYNNEEQWITDTIIASGDRFTWQADLAVPTRVGLKIDSVYYYFFAAPGHMQLTGRKDDPENYILKGAPMQKDADVYKKQTQGLTHEWDSLFKAYDAATDQEKQAIDNRRSELKLQSSSIVSQFIQAHPKSFFSMYLIGLENNYEDIRRLYDKLDQSAKDTKMGQTIAKRLALLATRQIGHKVPDFTQADTSGHPVHFNTFRSGYQYILIDFWASWCAPCRAENPNVLKAYNQYKDKGFTVIGISLDDNANRWKKAIRQDKMPWTQISELNGWKNGLSSKLGIEFIPSNLLIDQEGKIIAKDLRGEDLDHKLKELMD